MRAASRTRGDASREARKIIRCVRAANFSRPSARRCSTCSNARPMLDLFSRNREKEALGRATACGSRPFARQARRGARGSAVPPHAGRRSAGRTRVGAPHGGRGRRRDRAPFGRPAGAVETLGGRGRSQGPLARGAGRSAETARKAACDRRGPALHHHAGRRQRRGQDDVDRQARAALLQARGLVGAARCGRHVPRRGARAARRLGRAQQRRGDRAGRAATRRR